MHFTHALGVAVIVIGSRVAYTEVFGPARYGNPTTSSPVWWAILALIVIVAAYSLGLPEHSHSRIGVVVRSVAAVGIGSGAISIAQLVLATTLLPRSSLLLVLAITPIWSLLVWNLASDAQARATKRDRVLLICDQAQDTAALRVDLDGSVEQNATLVDIMSVQSARITADGATPIIDRLATAQPTVIVLDRASQNDETIVAQVADAHRQGIRVRTLSLFYEGWLGKLPISELAQVSLLFDIGELHRAYYGRAKRVLDILLASLGCVALAVAVPFVAALNLVGNRGPLIFRQERVGRDGVPFTMLKFRTMREGTDSHNWTSADDPRTTSFGRVMRRTHLDELPQAINILRGQLSIVGPRPEQPEHVDELRTKIPFYDARHIVRPGLTGWAQVKQGYAASETDALEKLQYDFYYLRRQSIAFDLRIVSRTLREITGGKGR